MELELQHQVLEGYHLVCQAEFGQEETLDSIVPDSFPDVARIVSAAGKAFLKEKETGEGTLRLTGAVCVNVLYIPEGEESVRALEVTLPFQCSKDCPDLHQGMPVHGEVTAAFSDARIINPRKILVRSSLLCSVCAYEKERMELTSDVNGCQENCVEKQFSHYKCNVISELSEKAFAFSDVLRQAASKPEMEELLTFRAELGNVDGKVIGKKLVCKGDLQLVVLYRSGTDIVPARFELPFSQIVELMNATEEGVPELSVVLKSAECRLQDGGLEVVAEGLIQCAVWVQMPTTVMSDVYCTSCMLEADRSPHLLCVAAEQGKRRETARQFCESGIPGKQVLDCRAAVESITTEESESGRVCRAQCNVDILYLSEDNALCGVNYTVPVQCEIPGASGKDCRWSCRPIGEVMAVPVTGGLEVRFEAEFSWVTTETEKALCVDAVRHSTKTMEHTVRPSVVIRTVQEGDSLWEIAKSCGSTVSDICSANGLQSETISGNAVLLIPAKRG